MVQDFLPYATPDLRCGIRIFVDECDAPTNLGNEAEADPRCLVFIVPNRLAEFLISFGKEL